MVSAIPVVTVRPDIAGLASTFLTSGRLCSRPVHRTCVVYVDQLTSRMTDTNRSRKDDEGSQHSAQSQDVNDRRFAEYKDEDGQNQCQAGRPHELLGIFLVPLERGIRHDTLDPILLTLAGVHRHDGASEEYRLGAQRSKPRRAVRSDPSTGPTRSRRPRPESRRRGRAAGARLRDAMVRMSRRSPVDCASLTRLPDDTSTHAGPSSHGCLMAATLSI